VILLARKNRPIFPDDYVEEKADEYNNSKWRERNQKISTILSLKYLFDEKLRDNEEISLKTEDSALFLDLGCGSGFSSEIIIEKGFRVIGVDILSDMLLKAREKKKSYHDLQELELILADSNYLPFKNEKIDYIISISAYNFITNETSNLKSKAEILSNTAKSLNKIMKKKGRMVIEFYPESEKDLELFNKSFIKNEFEGFMIKGNPNQQAGQTFLLLKKKPKDGSL
jgi:ubiquinone/menaquinone biosynthesis C-methylase UbiE